MVIELTPDQWNRIESEEIYSLQLILNKDAKRSQWKRNSLSTNDARTSGYPYVKNSKCIPFIIIETQLKMNHTPIIKPKTIKLLEKKMGENLCGLGPGTDFLNDIKKH